MRDTHVSNLPFRAIVFLIFGLWISILGCKEPATTATKKLAPVTPVVEALRAEAATPADVRFKRAVLLKPSPQTSESAARMAPLIVLELSTQASNATHQGFGLLTVDEQDRIFVDRSQPAVFVFEENGSSGTPIRRVAHLWFHDDDTRNKDGHPIDFSCIRMTLNATGAPVLWEVYDTRRKVDDLVYAARSLERHAARQFGNVQAGRTFVMEREAGVRIARLLDDGPEPMGPMVYLSAEHAGVAALACRCMPSQVDAIADASYYELVSNRHAPEQAYSLLEQIQLFFEMNGLQLDARAMAFFSRELNEHLRLPDGF